MVKKVSINHYKKLTSGLFPVVWSVFCLFLTSCTLKGEISSIVSGSVDPTRSKIVVPAPAQGIADGVSKLSLRVYAYDEKGESLVGFKPVLGVFGQGEHTISCEPVQTDYAECFLTATKGGDKLIFAINAVISEMGRAFFGEDSNLSLMVVKKSPVPANGTAKALIEVQLKNPSGAGRPGVHPRLFVESSDNVNIQCSVTSVNGISQCQLSSLLAGIYKIQSKSPALLPVEVEFSEAKLRVIEGRAFAGVTGSSVQIEVTSNSMPTLSINPSANAPYSCVASSSGKFLCTMTSPDIGARVVGVSAPAGISEFVEVYFASSFNSITIPPGQNPIADGITETIIEVLIKDTSGNPLTGVIPVAEVRGGGLNTIRCEASNAEGKAKCYITSTEPGSKTVTINDPPVKDVATIDFSASPVVKISDRVPADGVSPAIIEISTGDNESVIPELEITGPSEGKTKYFCTPSVKVIADNQAKSVCYITATESGPYTVTVKTPIQAEVPLTFTDSMSSMRLVANDDGQAKADGTDKVSVVVTAKNSLGVPRIGMTPSLQIIPDSVVTVTCSSVGVLGEAVCDIKSTRAGRYIVRSLDPLLSEEIVVVFNNVFGGIAADNSGLGLVAETNAVTDSKGKAIIYIEIKDANANPIVGMIPVLAIEGSGTNSYICYPSDSTGIAKCEITATEAGTKTVRIVSPPLEQTVTLNIQSNIRTCTASFSANTQQIWVGPALSDWGPCTISNCEANYTLTSNTCTPNTRSCSPMPTGAQVGTQIWDSRNTDKTWGYCTISSCLANYTLTPSTPEANNSCVAEERACPADALLTHFYAGTQTWNGTDWGVCKATICNYPYKINANTCITADTEPTLTGFFVDEVNATIDQVYNTTTLVVSGLDRSVPVALSGGIDAYIETRRTPGTWVNRGSGILAASLVDPTEGIQNGDEIRVVSKASSSFVTTTTTSLIIGTAPALQWSITTTSALPPSNPVLTHSPNMKTFQISWGTGGLNNGGAGQCQLQYYKNPSWDNLGTTYNCDLAQGTTTVTLPADGWVNGFAPEGVPVRLIRLTDNSTVLTFANKLTCAVDTIMPLNNNPMKDENCDGLWANEDDSQAPTGGSFTLVATDSASSTDTGSTNVNLNITCPTDQAGGVQVAYGNTANPTNWVACAASKSHTLVAGTGSKTVYVRFKDSYGNTTSDITQNILLDQSAPTGGSLTINGGLTRTNLTTATLNITCPSDSNAPIEMAFGATASPTNWEACTSSKGYTLTGGDGSKTVYIRFKDKFDNISADTTASIILDQTGAVSSLSYANGWVNSLSLALTASATDAQNSTPFVCAIEAQEAVLSGATPGAYGSFSQVSNSCVNTTYTLTDGKAYKLRMMATDSLGNIGSYVTPSLEVKVDTQTPTISGVSATTSGTQPACGTVRVTVSGASDSGSGLATSAYSFDGGSTWQASSTKDFSTTSLSLTAGQIQVKDGALNIYSYSSVVSGSAVACSCNLPWGGTINNGQSVTAYASASPVYPSTCAGVSETRTCSGGVLSGSNTAQSCTQQYTYSWYQGGWGSCPLNSWSYSGTGSCSASCGGGSQTVTYTCPAGNQTQTQTVYCQRNDGTQVADGLCSGGKPSTSQSCYQTSCSGGNPSYSQSCNTQSCCAGNMGQSCQKTAASSCTNCASFTGSSPVSCPAAVANAQANQQSSWICTSGSCYNCSQRVNGTPEGGCYASFSAHWECDYTQPATYGTIQCDGSCN